MVNLRLKMVPGLSLKNDLNAPYHVINRENYLSFILRKDLP